MNADDTQHVVQMCETPAESQAAVHVAGGAPVRCQSPPTAGEDIAATTATDTVANCAISSSAPVNVVCDAIQTTTTRSCSQPDDTATSVSSQPDAGTTSRVVLVNGRAVSVTSDENPAVQPPAGSRAPRARRSTRHGPIGLSAPTLLTHKTTNVAAPVPVIGGSEADFKVGGGGGGSGGVERRQSGWARLRRWRSHRERRVASPTPFHTPPGRWSPLATTSPTRRRPITIDDSESPPVPITDTTTAKSSNPTTAVPLSNTCIHRPSLRNTCGQYVREQLLSFSQPSDNRLSMKLFGSKNAFVREKLRRTAAASSSTGSSWLIHPCSNFRLVHEYRSCCERVAMMSLFI